MAMTFDEFKDLAYKKTAQFMKAPLSDKRVQEALAMDDAQDVIDEYWDYYSDKPCGEYTRQQILEQGAAAAASCIRLLA